MSARRRRAVRSRAARNKLVARWIYLPARVVKDLWHRDAVRALGRDDAEQIGQLALLRAAELWRRHNPTGASFKSYAYRTIWHRVTRAALSRSSIIPTPEYLWDPHHHSYNAPKAELAARTHDIAGLSPDGLALLEDRHKEPDPDAAEEAARLLTRLPGRQAAVLRALFLEGKTTKQLARKYGIGVAAVNLIKNKALRRLRETVAGSR